MNGLISTLAPEIIARIGEGRAPTLQELGRVADRIRAEVYHSSSAFLWRSDDEESAERLLSYRLALAALTGVPSVEERMTMPAPSPVIAAR